MATYTQGAPPKAPGDTRDTMKALVRYGYGSPDVLELSDIDKPEIADDEVLVRVGAAGVDRGVWHVMTDLPYPIRFAGFGLRAPKNPVIGMDLAGVVEAVGKGVSRFRPGDEVFGTARAPTPSTHLRSRTSPRPSPPTSPSSRRL
jgi:NADPH:quinone reductase-like Zn-dependent oxidoreductase